MINHNNFLELFRYYIKPYKAKLIIAILFMIIIAICNAVQAYMIKPIMEHIFLAKDEFMLSVIPCVILVTNLIRGGSDYIQNLLMRAVGQRIVGDIQQKLFEKLIYSDHNSLKSFHSGNIISRFSNDIQILKNCFLNITISIARDSLTLIFLIIAMFYLDSVLAFIVMGVLPIAIYPIVKKSRQLKSIALETQEGLAKYITNLDEVLNSINVVKSYQAEDYETRKSRSIISEVYQKYFASFKIESTVSPITEIASGITIAFLVYYGGTNVINDQLSAGTFFAFIGAFVTAYKPIKSIAYLNNSIQQGLAANTRLFSIINLDNSILENKNPVRIKAFKDKITFSNVCFKYENEGVLKNFNLTINKGNNIAIVGKSGAGKSTLITLLMRFYDPDNGSIKIDDIDITSLKISDLRSLISYVSQDVKLFDTSILENINYGSNKLSKNDLNQIIKITKIEEFTDNLPNKLDSIVGQNGAKLSGGQKQRICIARALARNAEILIMDEASSALDTVTENSLFQDLKVFRKNKTNIFITHRISTISFCDNIVVIDKNKIIDTGTHNELIRRCSLYQKIVNSGKSKTLD